MRKFSPASDGIEPSMCPSKVGARRALKRPKGCCAVMRISPNYWLESLQRARQA